MQRSMLKHLVLIIFFATFSITFVKAGTVSALKQKKQEAFSLGEKAYIYGFPLVLMDATKQRLTNFPQAGEEGAPINQFMHKRRFSDSSAMGVIKPNQDALYSAAFLDLSKEPLILHVPRMDNRYYVMPILDAWTNVSASIGTRTTGSKEGYFILTGPGWNGDIPDDLKEIKLPTNMAWLIGRTQTKNSEDYPVVNELQNQYTLIPLSAYQKPYQLPSQVPIDPSIDMKKPPLQQVEEMDVSVFFTKLAKLMKKNVIPAGEEKLVQKFEKIGILPGEAFDVKKYSSEVVKEIERGAELALRKIKEAPTGGKIINGWKIMANGAIGTYGGDYLQRARMAYLSLGTNLPKDMVYLSTEVDHTGRVLNGKNMYVLHFSKDQMLPVQGFWSLTLYDERQLFSANRLNRYKLGTQSPLKYNSDGSLDIYVQHYSPGPYKESNWLPAPYGKFSLLIRLYWPESSVLDDRWVPPAVRRMN